MLAGSATSINCLSCSDVQWTLYSNPIPSDVETKETYIYMYTLAFPELKAEHFGTYTCWGKLFDDDPYTSFYSISTIEKLSES